jgi:peptide/nickel transport system ATP-binding protein
VRVRAISSSMSRAMAPNPEVLICDEPVSALDVSIQAQILDLFGQLGAQTGVALLFISHDLAVVRQVCDWVLVMKDGAIVETGDVGAVFAGPQHPHARALLAALPIRRPSTLTAV